MPPLRTVQDVVSWRMCLGCGACAYICPEKKISLRDFTAEGIRPVLQDTNCGDCKLCVQVCPAAETNFLPPVKESDIPEVFQMEWGPVLQIWEGHAADPDIRFRGSSGGVLTAISAYCLEVLGMGGILHTGQDPVNPIRNRTRLSRSRQDLLEAVGSRYSPASICNGLNLVEDSAAPCVVIGKPAEIAAVRNAEKLRPTLKQKVGLTLSFFCAETPSTEGTLDLLKREGVDAATLRGLRYRGEGWPGHFAPFTSDSSKPVTRITYRESWAFLQQYRPWSVQLWPDGGGELADISCGDAWYNEPDGKNPGSSLVVVRTRVGLDMVRGAIAAGYIELQPAEPWKLAKSQANLLNKKGSVWGRRLAMRALALPVGRFGGAGLIHCWQKISAKQKIKSALGTFRRVVQRRYIRPLDLSRSSSVLVALVDKRPMNRTPAPKGLLARSQ